MSEQIRSWLSSQHEAMLSLMKQVVNIDSGSYDKAGVDAVGEVFEAFFRQHDIEVERLPQDIMGDIFRARIPGPGNAPIVLMGHSYGAILTMMLAATALAVPVAVVAKMTVSPGITKALAGVIGLLGSC